ncbi:MAG: hypothetical protein NT076_04820, partial [Candidatus Pacearchaeota archaeon]|nr:hypothetical protein [Candidatus Pacearchaeota archaeon]
DSKVDLLVALDENTVKIHSKSLAKNAIIMKGEHENMYFAGRLFKILCIDFKILEEQLKKLKNFDENLKEARKGWADEKNKIKLEFKNKSRKLENGSKGIALGSIESGLDVYYAYPMTPATPVMFELAPLQEKNNFLVLELESEIAVMNAALGSAIAGAKAMIGTSGGGFDLMTEALSMAGMAEIPIVCYLASRPGPSTGVATYTGQGDLNLSLYSGHGEFSRIVLAPGTPDECRELTSQAFYFSQKFKIPALVLSDKHLAESFFSMESDGKTTKSEKLTDLKRYNSYESNENGEATEDAEIISRNVERRLKKAKEIEKEAGKFEQYKVYGNKNSKNIVVSYGSTKGAILDALPEGWKFIQILYLEPFPKKLESELKRASKLILVENSATGMLGDLIMQKTGIRIEKKILRYDGRPFFADELRKEIERAEGERGGVGR